MYLSVIKIYPAPEYEHSVVDVLDSMKGPIAAISDSLGCSLAIEPGDGGNVVSYTEKWRNREALDRHLNSPLYGRVLEAMEFSRLPPLVEFYEVTAVGGLEVVEKVRGPQGIH